MRIDLQMAILCAGLSLGVLASRADIVAYDVLPGTAGNQAFGGALGMDFNTVHAVVVEQIGVFDDGSNGINAPITGRLWNRADTVTPLASFDFTNADPGNLIGGSRFKPLTAELVLPMSFQGTIAAGGYNAAERNGNGNNAAPTNWSINDGGGLIQFVGGGRFEPGGTQNYPTGADGGPANRYAAGSFIYRPANIAYELPTGTVGTQAFGGSLGMDFDVGAKPVRVTHLGVFDSGSDGLNLDITARLYDRNGTELAAQVFTGTDGTLIGGSRFRSLTQPIILPPGFQGTIVGEGYGASELNGNNGATGFQTYDGDGALQFTGSSRFGGAGAYPTSVDNHVSKYAAGTFRFQVIPEPSSMMLVWLGLGILGLRRLT